MDVLNKAKILGDAGKFDSCGPKQCEIKVSNNLKGLYHAESENKNCIMLKTLMTNKCSFDCKYCPNSSRSEYSAKTSFSSDELVKLFKNAQASLSVNGLFLSSGVPNNSDTIMSDMLDGVEKIRRFFRGYIHLKIMPGTSYDFIKRASEVANRVSVNIESSSASSLSELSDCKDFKIDILRRQAWIRNLGSSQSTQMIVTDNDSDKDILKMSDWEYNKLKVKRVYYSAFTPVPKTVLAQKKEVSLRRQNQLYNADFLLREYNFKLNELFGVMTDNYMFPLSDLKTSIAKNYFSGTLDVNEALREDLIRVPGIGLISASRILSRQRSSKISSLSELRRLGVNIGRAAPFLEIKGKRQTTLQDFSKKS